PGGRGGRFKTPKLGELHHHLFGEDFADAHNATADVEATARSFFELVRRRLWTAADLGLAIDQLNAYVLAHPDPIEKVGLKHINLKAASADLVEQVDQPAASKTDEKLALVENSPFFHVHTHSQFSVLQATSKIPEMIAQAASDGQPALAITDLGNMMGAFQFVEGIAKHNKQLPDGQRPMVGIVGMEAFLCRDLRDKSTKDDGFQIPLLAKNKAGFHHLAKLSSLAYVEGFYYLPRIDREALLEHKEHVMVTTGGLHGEVPKLILEVGESQAEEAFIWWKEQFGEDFYAEINRHGLPDEDVVNEVLLRFCAKHQVKMVAANNAFYVNQSQSEAHDILLCVKDNVKRSTPIGKGRGFRYGFANDQFYLKSQAEMHQAFADLPEALNNLSYVLAKVEPFTLAREVLLPAFDIPEDFLGAEDKADSGKRGENAYLKHLTYLGAEKRYSVITDEIKERIEFELETIAKTGYPGYFLIVQDFCNVARDMGVSVGPGRGSAAGSAVAYCTGITNVDPIAYQLLFERFLNPDRISLPDIDIDFDDKGRDKVIQYVIDKYGSSQVAQIITYGSMAAKSAIKDAARALDLPFDEADRLTKGTPDTKSLKLLLTGDEAFIKSTYHGEDYEKAKGLRTLAGGNDLAAETLNLAKELEGSMRNTGIHACGVIITPSDIRDLIPVARAKDSDMWCTQFDNAVVEDAGLLKMDFLGLKTLTIIKDSVL
ncbi:MAG: DNA polymerase III subunit alpha, partial [Proteobacteria bacterium]|nr:DNA polymerase III subunit alpha [Pseudomonadota bacterium]